MLISTKQYPLLYPAGTLLNSTTTIESRGFVSGYRYLSGGSIFKIPDTLACLQVIEANSTDIIERYYLFDNRSPQGPYYQVLIKVIPVSSKALDACLYLDRLGIGQIYKRYNHRINPSAEPTFLQEMMYDTLKTELTQQEDRWASFFSKLDRWLTQPTGPLSAQDKLRWFSFKNLNVPYTAVTLDPEESAQRLDSLFEYYHGSFIANPLEICQEIETELMPDLTPILPSYLTRLCWNCGQTNLAKLKQNLASLDYSLQAIPLNTVPPNIKSLEFTPAIMDIVELVLSCKYTDLDITYISSNSTTPEVSSVYTFDRYQLDQSIIGREQMILTLGVRSMEAFGACKVIRVRKQFNNWLLIDVTRNAGLTNSGEVTIAYGIDLTLAAMLSYNLLFLE